MKNIKISTEIDSIAKYVGVPKAIELLAKAGFDCWDFSMFDIAHWSNQTNSMVPGPSPLNNSNYKEIVASYKAVADKFGITCNQAHAPFPSNADFMIPYIVRSMECAALAGAKVIIVHPMNNADFMTNGEMFKKLLPYAKQFGIKIACENMWNWNQKEDHATTAACSHHIDFLKHVEYVNNDYLGACVDVGHASMRGLDTTPSEMIRTLNKHVIALHLHDVDLHHDCHQIPFSLNIDFKAIVEALKDIDYQGDLTLEASGYSENFKVEDMDKVAKNLKEAADKIRKLF